MPDCTLLLTRHCGPSKSRLKPNDFAAKAIAGLLEGRMANGHSLHIIHDLVPLHPINDGFIADFERMVGSRKVMRYWRDYDREWREDAKKQMEKANRGEGGAMLSPDASPEAAFILEANRQKPHTVSNHIGFYPLEAAIENTRYRIHLELSAQRMRCKDMQGGIQHVMAAHEAMASCNLLRDEELTKQIELLGHDVVVLRGFGSGYLAELRNLDLPIVEGGCRVVNFAEIVERRGIRIIPLMEAAAPTFADLAINAICKGGINAEEHGRLALLDIMFTSFLNLTGMWDDPEGFDIGHKISLRDYPGLHNEIFGQDAH